MSIFENMDPREIAMCLSAFYEADKKYTHAQLYGTQVYLPNREKPISIDRSDYDEGIKILRDDYEVFWTPDTKPDDLRWKINKRKMKELEERIQKTSWYGMLGGPGCAVDNTDIAKERDEADRLRRHWHSKYEKEHEECVRLSKLHAADKEKLSKQDTTVRNLRDNNTTLEYSVAALKKRIHSMEAEAAEKETKNKVIIDTLRDNLVDSVEECKKLRAKIREIEALYWDPSDTDNE